MLWLSCLVYLVCIAIQCHSKRFIRWCGYIILNAVASVALVQDSYPASEGMMVEVCAVIDNLPSDGLECPVVASLVAVDDKAGE